MVPSQQDGCECPSFTILLSDSKTKFERRQWSGINTIKYDTWPGTPYGKVTTHKKTLHTCPAGDHKLQGTDKTALQRQIRNTNNWKDPLKKHRLGTVSQKISLTWWSFQTFVWNTFQSLAQLSLWAEVNYNYDAPTIYTYNVLLPACNVLKQLVIAWVSPKQV